MARLEIRLLGPFEVTRAGRTVTEFETNSTRALLAYLAADPLKISSRPRVAEMLWPGRPEGAALSNLRHALSVLRKALGESEADHPVLVADRSRVSLDAAADVWIDLVEFEQLAATPPADSDAAAAWERAAALWRGPLLEDLDLRAGVEWDEWRAVTAERMRQQYATVLQNLVDHHERTGTPDAAIAVARRLVAVDQWNEPAHRQLMGLLAGAGRGTEALAHYDTIVALFADELGVAPASETTTLAEQIRAGDLARAAPPRQIALPSFLRRPARAPHPLFVDRERELDALHRHLDAAVAGSGRVVFVAGEAGSGKTMLAHELIRRASEVPGLLAAQGRCNAFGRLGDPYLPFREVLGLLVGDVESGYTAGALDREQATRLWETMPDTVRLLVELAPDLLGVMVNGPLLLKRVEHALPQAAWLDELRHRVERPAGQDRLQPALFDELTAVLERLSSTHPLLLVIDDLQWADVGSIALLWHLARRVQTMRVVLLGIYRPEEVTTAPGDQPSLGRVLGELLAREPDRLVELGEAREFVDKFIDAEPNALGSEFRDRLYDYTGGHALFTAEFVRGMQERAEIRRGTDGLWRASGSLDWDRLPSRVEAVIAQRFDLLPDQVVGDLTAAAVQGEEFVAEVVATVRADPAAAARLSHESRGSFGVVQPARLNRIDGRLAARHRFRHALFQRFLYDHLDPAERVRLHEATGRAIEALYDDHPEPPVVELARHFDEAGLIDPAIDYLYRAGQRAVQMSASEEAIGLHDRALELLATLPESVERAERELAVLASLGPAVVAARGFGAAEGERIGRRVLELSRRLEPSPLVVLAVLGLNSVLTVQGRYAESEAMIEMARSINTQVGDPAVDIQIEWQSGFSRTIMGDLEAGRESLRRAYEAFDPEAHAWLAAFGGAPGPLALAWSAVNTLHRGHPDEASKLAEEAIATARELGHPLTTCFTVASAGAVFRLMLGDYETALVFADEVEAMANKEHLPFFQVAATLYRAQAIGYLGDPARGIELIEQGLAEWAAMGTAAYRGWWLAALGEFEQMQGHTDGALGTLEGALAEARASGEGLVALHLVLERGRLLGQLDEAEALEVLAGASEEARTSGARLIELRAATELARIHHRRGDVDTARRVLEPVYSWFDEGFDSPYLVEARTVLDQL